jgi:hypothetical protein
VSAVDVADLGSMQEIDAGAFGTVYRLSAYALRGFADLAYKEFTVAPDRTEVANLTALVRFRDELDPNSRAVLDDAAAWPLTLVTHNGDVCGFLMQLIPPEFFGDQVLPSGRTVHLPVKSQWLVVDPSKADAAGIAVPRADDLPARLVLCAKLSHVLGVLHRAGFVYGDLSFNNVVFSAASPPRIMLVDCDAVQAPGTAPIAQAHTPDWTPPECVAGGYPQDVMTDRYKLALFVMRVLTPGPHASQSVDPSRVVGVLDLEGNDMTRTGVSTDRHLRATAKDWFDYLCRHLIALTSPPVFAGVAVDTAAAMAGAMVRVSWRVTGADRIVVIASDGHRTECDATSGIGECRVAVTRTGPFIVRAESRFGDTFRDTTPVSVLQPPTIARIDVPSIELPRLPKQFGTGGWQLGEVFAGIGRDLPVPSLADFAGPPPPEMPRLTGVAQALAGGLGDSSAVDEIASLLASVNGDVHTVVAEARAASSAAVGGIGHTP